MRKILSQVNLCNKINFIEIPSCLTLSGLSLTTLIPLLGMLQWGVRQSTETETLLTSVERLMEYHDLEREPKGGKSIKNWPKTGKVKIKNMSFSYNGKTNVLDDINLTIKDGEKIGICGRTGAGKSSLTTTLFRLRELRMGSIDIDGENSKDLDLACLRRGITLIPQEPIIFSNSIR
jgi:ATP-binding cassette subfamily C (CFTR/MRP) protein 4